MTDATDIDLLTLAKTHLKAGEKKQAISVLKRAQEQERKRFVGGANSEQVACWENLEYWLECAMDSREVRDEPWVEFQEKIESVLTTLAALPQIVQTVKNRRTCLLNVDGGCLVSRSAYGLTLDWGHAKIPSSNLHSLTLFNIQQIDKYVAFMKSTSETPT